MSNVFSGLFGGKPKANNELIEQQKKQAASLEKKEAEEQAKLDAQKKVLAASQVRGGGTLFEETGAKGVTDKLGG